MEALALIAERIIKINGYDADPHEGRAVSPNFHETVGQANGFEAQRVVVFFHPPHDASIYSATAYYSGHKGPPKRLMSQGSWDQAIVWHDIYVVDEGSELNPYVWWDRIFGFWYRIFGG